MEIVRTCVDLGISIDDLARKIRRSGRGYFDKVDEGVVNLSPVALRSIANGIASLADIKSSDVMVMLLGEGSGAIQAKSDTSNNLTQDVNLGDMDFSQFSQGEDRFKVRSKLLGEDVWFVPLRKDADEVRTRGEIPYTARELHYLQDVLPDTIRKVHAIKKHFDGTVTKVTNT